MRIEPQRHRGHKPTWTRAVMVHRCDRMQRLTEDDVLEGDMVLAGFQVKVSAIVPKSAGSG